jgi:hypothetical protein
MRRLATVVFAASCVALLGAPVEAAEETVTGMLVEAGCSATIGADGPSEDHVACMVRCGRRGEPLGIVTDDGLYVITGEWAASNTATLLELMAEQVIATGAVTDDGGQRMLELVSITSAD